MTRSQSRFFTLATFLSATLLLMVQPLVGKILLPVLGGSPAVWSTCMVFFQAVLLLGYLYAHLLSTRVPRRSQWALHSCVLIAASLVLPLSIDVGDPASAEPRWWVLSALTRTAGLPFFALSATAPLLQHWFSRTDDPRAGDPYFLYAASNAGSLLGLLGYLLVEPIATRSLQATGWAIGFWAVAALVAVCGFVSCVASGFSRKAAAAGQVRTPHASFRLKPEATLDGQEATPQMNAWRQRALWIVLALVPSALLLGVTQHLATDVVSAPLLWVVPLALYLVTFIAAFATRSFGSARRWGTVASFVVLLLLVVSLAEVRYPILPVTLLHLAAFTALAMMCHARLAESRPGPAHLTGYFVCVSLGGALGAVAAALVAPAVFSSILEYPLAIAAGLFLRPQSVRADRITPRARRLAWGATAILLVAAYWTVPVFDDRAASMLVTSGGFFEGLQSFTGDLETAQRAMRAALAIPAALLLFIPRAALLFAATSAGLLVGTAVTRTGGDVLVRDRTFFGVHQVTSVQNGDWHILTHGTTTHGVQAFRGKLRSLPTAYYHPSGPIGDVVFTLVPEKRLHDVAVIGLGAGALAAYAGNGVRMDFFEIDDAVVRIAEDPRYFTYLSDAKGRPGATVRTMAIDGRLGLRGMPEASYDLIVVDAFSSDAIPTHLLTREAVALYESRLKPSGLMAFHVSSRFFDLPPVVARIAAERGLVCYVRNDQDVPADKIEQGMRASVWVVLARTDSDAGQIAKAAPRWLRLAPDAGVALWTDDYTNALGRITGF